MSLRSVLPPLVVTSAGTKRWSLVVIDGFCGCCVSFGCLCGRRTCGFVENRLRLFLQPPALRPGTHCGTKLSPFHSRLIQDPVIQDPVITDPHLSESDLHIFGHVNLAIVVKVWTKCANAHLLSAIEKFKSNAVQCPSRFNRNMFNVELQPQIRDRSRGKTPSKTLRHTWNPK